MFKKSNTEPKFKKTKKKKDTYVVHLDYVFTDFEVFAGCRATPLPVSKKNGQPYQNTDGIMICERFPNPCAQELIQANKNPHFTEIMGPVRARTIVVYNNKFTGKPACYLFPTNVVVFAIDKPDEEYHGTLEQLNALLRNELNHASRQDLLSRMRQQQPLLEQVVMKTRQR